MILLLDNYDSFTYNLQQYLAELAKEEVAVFRNDEISLEDVSQYDRIVLSPGPGLPEAAGILIPLIKMYAPFKSILGVCLGHQAISVAFGSELKQLQQVLHGIPREVIVTKQEHPLFNTIPARFMAGRYHSWVPDEKKFGNELEILAEDDDQNIMILKHKVFPVYGMQFHPESILTPYGKVLIQNWLDITK
jgi:anthranilate synthase component II